MDTLLTHIISDANPQLVIQLVHEFVKDKKAFKTHYSVNTLIVGLEEIKPSVITPSTQRQAKPILQNYTSCLIIWESTIELAKEWFKQHPEYVITK